MADLNNIVKFEIDHNEIEQKLKEKLRWMLRSRMEEHMRKNPNSPFSGISSVVREVLDDYEKELDASLEEYRIIKIKKIEKK